MLTSPSCHSCSFDIILDCTSFTSNSEVPLQWLKYCAELIPMNIRTRFEVARILNPNTLTQKFMRRLYNISAGILFVFFTLNHNLHNARYANMQRNQGIHICSSTYGRCPDCCPSSTSLSGYLIYIC